MVNQTIAFLVALQGVPTRCKASHRQHYQRGRRKPQSRILNMDIEAMPSQKSSLNIFLHDIDRFVVVVEALGASGG